MAISLFLSHRCEADSDARYRYDSDRHRCGVAASVGGRATRRPIPLGPHSRITRGSLSEATNVSYKGMQYYHYIPENPKPDLNPSIPKKICFYLFICLKKTESNLRKQGRFDLFLEYHNYSHFKTKNVHKMLMPPVGLFTGRRSKLETVWRYERRGFTSWKNLYFANAAKSCLWNNSTMWSVALA